MKNLEAKDEIYKGIFRTPFAIIFGGPFGVIINSIYTALSVNHEIVEAENHKKYISSMNKPRKSLREMRIEEEIQNKKRNEKINIDTKYMMRCFEDAIVPKIFNYNFTSDTYDKMMHRNSKVNFALRTLTPILEYKMYHGVIYDIIDFRREYDNDNRNNNIKFKILCKNEYCPTFVYITKDNKAVCAMRTGYLDKEWLDNKEEENVFWAKREE